MPYHDDAPQLDRVCQDVMGIAGYLKQLEGFKHSKFIASARAAVSFHIFWEQSEAVRTHFSNLSHL